MYYHEKQLSGVFFIKKCSKILLVFTGLLFLIVACSKDPEELKNNPPQQNNPQGQNQDSITPQDSTDSQNNLLDPDVISEYLVLQDASKITGNAPRANDGQIQTDVKDTIYLVKGYPMGNRIRFKHDPSQKVAGFNIQLSGSSFYYYVPETITEGQSIPPEEHDSIAVLVLDLDLETLTEAISYPFTTDLVIKPVDIGGTPLDSIYRPVTIEDPASGKCKDITQPVAGYSSPGRWKWEVTYREYNGEILDYVAPDLALPINSQGAGCCSGTGLSFTVSDHPGCVANVNSSDMQWVALELDDYIIRTEEYVWFYDNGDFNAGGIEDKKTYDRSATNFCTGEVGYNYAYQVYGAPNDTPVGTHDFTSGATDLNLNLRNWQGPYRMPSSVEMVYSCHILLLKWGKEDKFTAVYEDKTSYYNTSDTWFN